MLRRTLTPILITLALALFLAACGGGAATPAPDGLRAPQPTQAVVVTRVASASTSVPSGDANIPPLLAEQPGRMIIKDGQMDLVVPDVTIAVSQISQMAADNGGYILDSQAWTVNNSKRASLRLAVPASAFEQSLNFLRTAAQQVVKESTSGQDVSADYVDLQTRLGNLEATSARVREFLNEAKSVEESLKVNQQLTDLEGQIAQIKGQMQYYEGRSAYSTITVQLSSPDGASATAPNTWDPNQTFDKASAVLVKFSQGLTDLLIWLVVVPGPFLFIGLLLFVTAHWLSRKFAR